MINSITATTTSTDSVGTSSYVTGHVGTSISPFVTQPMLFPVDVDTRTSTDNSTVKQSIDHNNSRYQYLNHFLLLPFSSIYVIHHN